jgi:hypothetical protein
VVPRTPRPVFRSRCTGRRTTCKAPLCRRRSTVSTLTLRYAAAASRSSNRGPWPSKADDTDGRRDAERAGDAATGSLVRGRALVGRPKPARAVPPSGLPSNFTGSPRWHHSQDTSRTLRLGVAGTASSDGPMVRPPTRGRSRTLPKKRSVRRLRNVPTTLLSRSSAVRERRWPTEPDRKHGPAR